MFNLSVYEAIEIINAIPEILIIALFITVFLNGNITLTYRISLVMA